MTRTRRRDFCRALGSLACVGLGGCKIEPILGIDSEELQLPPTFPELRAQIPDQLADAETTLRMLTEQLLAREQHQLLGNLRERPSHDPRAVPHLVEIMRRCGLSPAGNRSGWLQPVMLDVVEPTGAEAMIRLRPEAEPEPEPERLIDLAALGAFRQRGAAKPHTALLLGPLLDYKTPLASDKLAGRVALFRAPSELDLDDPSAMAHIDVLMSSVRDAGALGCLLLTNDAGPAIDRFRAQWQRQVRRPTGGGEQAMLIEGLLAKPARSAISDALRAEAPWVLDLDLATRNFEVESHNVLGAVLGRGHPDEAVVLTCAWDTPDPLTAEVDTTRLLTSLATFFQLAEWSRRSTPAKYSLILLLTVNAGLAAGTAVHATWTVDFGARTKAVLALDQPTRELLPALLLSGHYDPPTAEIVRRVVSADGRDLLLVDQLAMPSLAPYLRYPAPVMTIGVPDADALSLSSGSTSQTDLAELADDDPNAGLFADVRLLRNLLLALAN
jgi:hypothetical protein